MSKCSQSSRSLLVQMRDRLKHSLEREGIAPPSDSPPCSVQPRIVTPEPTPLAVQRSELAPTDSFGVHAGGSINLNLRHLDCAHCIGFMVQPVCLPCGHSVCKSCLDKTMVGGAGSTGGEQLLACPSCGNTFPLVPLGFNSSSSTTEKSSSSGAANAPANGRRPTVILQNALEKWFPDWVESGKHKDEGNVFANEGDFPMAVHWYSQALQTGESN